MLLLQLVVLGIGQGLMLLGLRWLFRSMEPNREKKDAAAARSGKVLARLARAEVELNEHEQLVCSDVVDPADLVTTFADVGGLVQNNRIFLDRTMGVGVVDLPTALSHGFTGPCLRALGVPLDLRKAQPYWGYDQYAFDVPVGTEGDTYRRVMLRFAELEESRRIILQAIDKLPDGPVLMDHP